MENPAKIKIRKSAFDWTLEALCLLGLLWCFYPLFFYGSLPEQVPTHFNFQGQADDWSGKGSLWALPVITLILYIGMTVLQQFPHLFNYPVKIKEANLPQAYRFSVRMVSGFKLMFVLMFGYIGYQVYSMAMGYTDSGVGWWFIPVVIIGNLALIIFTVSRLNKIG